VRDEEPRQPASRPECQADIGRNSKLKTRQREGALAAGRQLHIRQTDKRLPCVSETFSSVMLGKR